MQATQQAEGQRVARPVMIVGAPRSGTSLLHRVLRGCRGCGAVAAEAQHIWQPYTHPVNRSWEAEGCDPSMVDDGDLRAIRRQFAADLLPFSVWRRFDAAGGLGRQRQLGIPRPLARSAHRLLLTVSRWTSSREPLRLIEKSVHAGLWLDLVEAVFPDIVFVHIVRSPWETIDSIRRGWLTPGRFVAFEPEGPVHLPGSPDAGWKFPLPKGWQAYVNEPLSDVAAFQWLAVQESILAYERACRAPMLRVSLESLVAAPREVITDIAAFTELPWQRHLEKLAQGLPKVNPDEHADTVASRCDGLREDLAERVTVVAEALGYG